MAYNVGEAVEGEMYSPAKAAQRKLGKPKK